MKIRAICVMKDEVDVIEQTLQAASQWCDQIIVLDNGSSDGSWETVVRLAERDPRIVPHGRDLRPFEDGMRARCFNAFASGAASGDWWCRLDADEFCAEDPRPVLAAAPADAFSVWSAGLVYYFTDVDAARFDEDPGAYADEMPIEDRCRYYLNHTSEPRFFRHEPGLRWTELHSGFPLVLWTRPINPRRIVMKNFRYRSPQQIQRRMESRLSTGAHLFSQDRIADWSGAVARLQQTGGELTGDPAQTPPTSWRDRVAPAAALDFDRRDGTFVLRESLMPELPEPLPSRYVTEFLLKARLRQLFPAALKRRIRHRRDA